jgi:hypothetical protein
MTEVGIIVQENHPNAKKTQDPNVFVTQEFKPRFVFIRICHFIFFSPDYSGNAFSR